MTLTSMRALPALHELRALDATELKQIPVVTPTQRMLQDGGLWAYVDENDGRFWIGQMTEQIHPEDRWLYHSTLEGEPEAKLAFWHGLVSPHVGYTAAVLEVNDIDPYLSLQTFNSQAYNTQRSLRGFTDSPERDGKWLMAFGQLFGGLGEYLISLLPERVDWAVLHDIIWHLDAFRARHEIEAMPLDLILRMHGFAKLAEEVERVDPIAGIVWKETIFDD